MQSMNYPSLTSPSAQCPAPSLNRADLVRTASNLLQVLESYLPSELYGWAAEYRPDVLRYLLEAREDLSGACFAGDRQTFIESLSSCTSMYLKAVSVYQAEMKRAAVPSFAPLPLHPWPGLVLLRKRQDTGNPRATRAALTLSTRAVFRAPAPPQEKDHANGPDEVAACL
jgi:hypothetical protein